MKLFIILINIILAGSVVHAMEPADISPLVRYEGVTGWAEIPVVKAEIDCLRDAATKLRDAITFVSKADPTLLAPDQPGIFSRRKDRVEWYPEAIRYCGLLINLAEILASDSPARINDLQRQLVDSNGESLNGLGFYIDMFLRRDDALSLVDNRFTFSGVSNVDWGILIGDGPVYVVDAVEYAEPLIKLLCTSVINIKKMLGFQRDPDSFGQYLFAGEE